MSEETYFLVFIIAYSFFAFSFIMFLLFIIAPLAFMKRELRTPQEEKIEKEGVSVIIIAKNESKNLQKHLKSVLEQDYPLYEIIVASDHSTDNTAAVINEFQKQYIHLRFLDVQDWHNSGKKTTLTKAVFYAKYPILLFTDADCSPQSNQWITKMVAPFDNQIEIVLGYGAYFKKTGLLNALIRFDAAEIALWSFGFAKAKLAYMGVGRNMAYKRQLFIDSKGFINHLHIASGDDDLFVQENARKNNVAFVMDEAAETRSEPKQKLVAWRKQKRRHQSTSVYYRTKFKLLLGWLTLSKFIVYFAWIPAFFVPNPLPFIFIPVATLLIHFSIFNIALRQIKAFKIALGTPIFTILLLLNTLYLGVTSVFIKDKDWK